MNFKEIQCLVKPKSLHNHLFYFIITSLFLNLPCLLKYEPLECTNHILFLFLFSITEYSILLNFFIHLFLAVLGLRCCMGSPLSSCSDWGLLSSCGEQASHCSGFVGAGAQAQAQ